MTPERRTPERRTAKTPDTEPDGELPGWKLLCATRAGGDELLIGSIGREGGWKVALLDDGSAYLVGGIAEAAVFGEGEPNETQFPSSVGWSDGYLARYAPDCSLDWVRRIGGGGEELSFDVAVLGDGSAAVVGYFRSDQIVFGEGEPNETALTCALQGEMSDCAALARYGPDGSLVWARDLGVLRSQVWHASVAADSSILVAGHFYGGPTDPDLAATGFTLAEDEVGVLIAKFNPEDGSLEWARLGSAGFDVPNGAHVGTVPMPDGDVLAFITFDQALVFEGDDPGQQILESAGQEDMALVRLSAQGEILWMYRLGNEDVESIFGGAQLAGESIWITGAYTSDPLVATSGHGDDVPLPLAGDSDVFLMRFGPTVPPR
jgi:hypothetical protein